MLILIYAIFKSKCKTRRSCRCVDVLESLLVLRRETAPGSELPPGNPTELPGGPLGSRARPGRSWDVLGEAAAEAGRGSTLSPSTLPSQRAPGPPAPSPLTSRTLTPPGDGLSHSHLKKNLVKEIITEIVLDWAQGREGITATGNGRFNRGCFRVLTTAESMQVNCGLHLGWEDSKRAELGTA